MAANTTGNEERNYRDDREAKLIDEQHKYAGKLFTGTHGAGGRKIMGAREMLRDLNEPGRMAYMRGEEAGVEKDRWKQDIVHNIDMTNGAIQRFTECVHYYPEWEEAYLMRGEAYRCRANLYTVPPGKEGSHTEKRLVVKMKTADLRRGLADVEHVLRFWDPSFLKKGGLGVPETGIEDAYDSQPLAAYINIYAKAWLMRGHIRAELNLDYNEGSKRAYNQPYNFEEDFEISKSIDPYDVNLYVAWGRACWYLGEFDRAEEVFKDGTETIGTKWKAAFAARAADAPPCVMRKANNAGAVKRLESSMEDSVQFLAVETQLMNKQKEQKDRHRGGGCTIC